MFPMRLARSLRFYDRATVDLAAAAGLSLPPLFTLREGTLVTVLDVVDADRVRCDTPRGRVRVAARDLRLSHRPRTPA